MAIRTRTLLTGSTIAMLMSSGVAVAQDATIHYHTPIIRAGQPVAPVPVVTPIPVPTNGIDQAGAPDPVTPPSPGDSSAPNVQTSADGSISYVSGGTGYYEKQWFTSHAHEYNLKATYNDSTGHNLAGVNATLADSSGAQLFTTTTDGPFLLVKAKPGSYTLTSTYEGNTQSKKITIGKGLATAGFVFAETNPDM